MARSALSSSLQDLVSRAYNLKARIQKTAIASRRTVIYLDGQLLHRRHDQQPQMVNHSLIGCWKQIIPVN
jgi:hypothetical protein